LEKSSELQCANNAFGTGASTNVRAMQHVSELSSNECPDYAPTKRGSQLLHSAQDKMMSRKPTARKKDRKITAVTGRRQILCIILRILADFLAFRPSWSGQGRWAHKRPMAWIPWKVHDNQSKYIRQLQI
jgi:hypothetical protein